MSSSWISAVCMLMVQSLSFPTVDEGCAHDAHVGVGGVWGGELLVAGFCVCYFLGLWARNSQHLLRHIDCYPPPFMQDRILQNCARVVDITHTAWDASVL